MIDTGNGNMKAKTGNSFVSDSRDRNSDNKSGVFDHGELDNNDNDRHPEMELQLLWR